MTGQITGLRDCKCVTGEQIGFQGSDGQRQRFVGEMTPKNNDINFCLTVEFCRVKTEIESILPNQDS